jgi:hypothetical protein
VAFQQTSDGNWHRGLGDVAFAFNTLFHSLEAGTIVSAAAGGVANR